MRILIVEDEPKMVKLLKAGLEEEGHSVMAAQDGIEGFEVTRTYPFDVIILDIMLPGMTGFEVARRLRDAKNHVPILMLTARDAVSDIVKGLHLGADDYLTKPFAFHELLARLEAISRRGPVEGFQPPRDTKPGSFMGLLCGSFPPALEPPVRSIPFNWQRRWPRYPKFWRNFSGCSSYPSRSCLSLQASADTG
jgi:DNA-binding response OmpR family regulator